MGPISSRPIFQRGRFSGFILNTSGVPRIVGGILVWRSHSSLPVHHLTRCFHISSAVQAKRNFQESGFMMTPRKPKREKKEKRTQAPVEAPYVPPKPKKIVRSSPGKIIDIFDGMTLAELAKRTGEGIDILQDILSNIGEQVSLEFQPITMDVAELIAMIRLHRVIYHLLEDIGNLIVSMAPGICETQVAGEAQILNIFELKGRSKAKGDDAKIAGCRVIDGRISKTARLRVLRSGEMVFEGNCQSLKREKQDVEAVGKGNECGLIIQEYDGFQIGDVIQCLELVNRKPKFVSSESGAVRIEC